MPPQGRMLSALLARPWRSLLSIVGVACGVFALLLLASLAAHFDSLGQHVRRTFENRVYVCEKPTFWAGGGLISAEKAKAVENCVQGLAPQATVIPLLVGRLETRRMVVVGVPQVLVGLPPESLAAYLGLGPGEAQSSPPLLAQGRLLGPGDQGTWRAVAGADVVATLRARPGQTVEVLGARLELVGVLAPSSSLEDKQLLVPLDTARRMLDREGLLTSLVVFPPPPSAPTSGQAVSASSSQAEQLAAALKRRLHGVEALPPSRIEAEAASSLRLWHALTLGLGLLAVLSGCSGVVLTMVVAVHERVREIGLKKALGASRLQIASEMTGEALVLAALGWLVGTAGAALFVWVWKDTLRDDGLVLFVLYPPLLVRSLLVTLLMAGLGALAPALRAATMPALRALQGR